MEEFAQNPDKPKQPIVVYSKKKLRLTPKQKQIAQLKLAGKTNKQIAEILKCSQPYVSSTVRHPNVQEIITEESEVIKQEAQLLGSKAVLAISDILDTGTNAEKLRAAELVIKVNPDWTKVAGEIKTEGIEDICQRIMAASKEINININTNTEKETGLHRYFDDAPKVINPTEETNGSDKEKRYPSSYIDQVKESDSSGTSETN